MTERIKDKVPINRMTSIVVGKGTSFEFEMPVPINERLYSACPELKEGHVFTAEDYRGLKIGWLTVIGVLFQPTKSPNQKASWVCKCDCGNYTTRRAKVIEYRKEHDGIEGCALCKENEYLKNGTSRYATRLKKQIVKKEKATRNTKKWEEGLLYEAQEKIDKLEAQLTKARETLKEGRRKFNKMTLAYQIIDKALKDIKGGSDCKN